MDTENPFLETKKFQQLIIFIISVAFGTGLSAAYSIADYMHSVKSEFQDIHTQMKFNHAAIYTKIDHQSALIKQRIDQQEKESELIQKFITKHDYRFYKVEEDLIKLKSKH